MKNIAIVIDSLTGGGAERVMISLATELVKQGHKINILSLSNQCDYEIPEGISVDYLFEHKASKVDRFWNIKASVAKLEAWFVKQAQNSKPFDLVLSNLDRSNNLLTNSRVKSVYYIVHNSVEEELTRQKKLGVFAYRYLRQSKQNLSGQSLITVSKGLEKEVTQSSLIKPKSIRTIYNPFNIDDIQQKSLLEKVDIPTEPYIIHVGRLARQKRHDVLFQALALVTQNVKLVLLCNKPKKALKLAKKYGVVDRVILPGFQSNPYNWIKQAKALVLSSDYEGLPTVLLEAIAIGTKVVSTDCPHGPNEILTSELSEYLVPRRNPEQLAKTIDKALMTNLNISDKYIRQNLSADIIAEQYLALAS